MHVHVVNSMVKLVQPQEEMGTRSGRKKFIILTGSIEGVTTYHTGPQGEAPVSVRMQKRGRKILG